MRSLRPRGTTFGVLAAAVTAAFAVMVVVSLVYPALSAHRAKVRVRTLAEQSLPAGSVRTSSGVGGSGNGHYVGVASGHVDRAPAQVLSAPAPTAGDLGWEPIPDCGKDTVCWLSGAKDLILTLHVAPCVERGCPSGGTQVDAEVAEGGPNS